MSKPKKAKTQRKKSAKRQRKAEQMEKARAKAMASETPASRIDAVRAAAAAGDPPAPRGLQNLGNTCFFNSVMQNLARVAALRAHFVGGEPPAGEGPITSALRAFMVAQWDVRARGTYNPLPLFAEVGKKNARFKGRNQQDAHELLRALLEAVIDEEKKRLSHMYRKQQRGHHCAPKGTADSSSASEAEGEEEEEEGKDDRESSSSRKQPVPASKLVTVLERFLNGRLCSTVVCVECGNKSSVYESFFDIPISLVPKEAPEETLSGKEAGANRRKKNGKKGSASTSAKNSQASVPVAPPPPPPPPPMPPRPVTPAPVAGSASFKDEIAQCASQMCNEAAKGKSTQETKEGLKNGAKAESNVQAKEEAKDLISVTSNNTSSDSDCYLPGASLFDDSDDEENEVEKRQIPPPPAPAQRIINTVSGMFGFSQPAPHGYQSISACLEEFTKVEVLENDNAYGCEECTRKEKLRAALRKQRSKPVKKPVKRSVDIPSVPNVNQQSPSSVQGTIENDVGHALPPLNGKSNGASTVNGVNGSANGHAKGKTNGSKLGNESESESKPAPGGSSMEVSSSPVTTSESGSYGERSEEDDTDLAEPSTTNKSLTREEEDALIKSLDVKIPTVKTTAHKRLLIETPPEVLVLQLKRFSQVGYRGGLRKISGHVDFPLELDLSKFIEKKDASPEDRKSGSKRSGSRNGKRAHSGRANGCKPRKASPGAGECRYVLTGVSVHGGSLSGGHYVAYVREGVDADCRGDWYYVSDSRVSRSSEDDVLKSEAYLLFYEKI